MSTVAGRRRFGAVRHAVGTRLAVRAALVVILVAGGSAAPASAATKGFAIDLGTHNDFVAQTNFVQCVGASMQMMLNMIRPGADRSAATQRRLQALAREWSGPAPDGIERQGASVVGWTAGLNLLGVGPYALVGTDTLDEALLAAARAIRLTGKPVGLLMWHGRHAWVMSGFRATTDPLAPGARVTSVIVEDPLYPFGSSTWGPSPSPGASISPATIGRQFVPRHSSGRWLASPWSAELAGKYVLVVPTRQDPRPYAHQAI
ncbi:MAG TPA: hypothetical protein VIU37_13720 [Candidatus Limnocylindrales bacterium]